MGLPWSDTLRVQAWLSLRGVGETHDKRKNSRNRKVGIAPLKGWAHKTRDSARRTLPRGALSCKLARVVLRPHLEWDNSILTILSFFSLTLREHLSCCSKTGAYDCDVVFSRVENKNFKIVKQKPTLRFGFARFMCVFIQKDANRKVALFSIFKN